DAPRPENLLLVYPPGYHADAAQSLHGAARAAAAGGGAVGAGRRYLPRYAVGTSLAGLQVNLLPDKLFQPTQNPERMEKTQTHTQRAQYPDPGDLSAREGVCASPAVSYLTPAQFTVHQALHKGRLMGAVAFGASRPHLR